MELGGQERQLTTPVKREVVSHLTMASFFLVIPPSSPMEKVERRIKAAWSLAEYTVRAIKNRGLWQTGFTAKFHDFLSTTVSVEGMRELRGSEREEMSPRCHTIFIPRDIYHDIPLRAHVKYFLFTAELIMWDLATIQASYKLTAWTVDVNHFNLVDAEEEEDGKEETPAGERETNRSWFTITLTIV